MSRSWVYVVTGLEDLQEVGEYAEKAKRSASQAINKMTRDYRKVAAELIMQEVKFPTGYLSPSSDRLRVGRRASPMSLEGSIIARTRPTSLARFVTGGGARGSSLTVEVKRGNPTTLKRAFLIPLRSGSGIETKQNMGLAIRLKPGESIRNKRNFRKLDKNLYLLYGPSVDQIFLQAGGDRGVAADIAPDILRDLQNEWVRLMELD